jgi:hypothetical protein
MKIKPILIFLLLAIFLSSCALHKDKDSVLESKLTQICKEQSCISMQIPSGSKNCDTNCAAELVAKLNQHGFTVNCAISIPAPASPRGCVGYRADLGGTEEGARYIAKILNYDYPVEGCNAAGWPYDVRTK